MKPTFCLTPFFLFGFRGKLALYKIKIADTHDEAAWLESDEKVVLGESEAAVPLLTVGTTVLSKVAGARRGVRFIPLLPTTRFLGLIGLRNLMKEHPLIRKGNTIARLYSH